MAELEYRKLGQEEINEGLAPISGWNVEENLLNKTFLFESYAAGAAFVALVAKLADELNHHPDLHLSYLKVVVSVNTHDVGGISPYDLELARRIEGVLSTS